MKTLIAAVACAATLGTAFTATTAHAGNYAYIAVPTPQPQPVRTPAYCDQYARDWANWVAGDRGARVAIGGFIGAGIGALIGNGAGRPGLGALIGAGIGAGIGAASNNPQWRAEYDNAYWRCINNYQLSYPWAY